MVFLDESGFSLALYALYSLYGWAARGQRLVESVPYARGKNLSLLGALSLEGLLCTRQKEGAMCRDDIEAFLRDDLLPRLAVGSVLVLDNATIHHGGHIAPLVAAAGCSLLYSLLYLPPYSPDFNPIEMAWGWVKQRVRREAPRDDQAREQSIDAAITALPNHCAKHWFKKCGIEQH